MKRLKDKDIREPLFEYLEERFGKSRILEEKQIGKSRADVMMILPEEIVGIEIKSDADTYVRLERQVHDYSLYFDRNYVVVGTTHAERVGEHIPEDWGILVVECIDGEFDFYQKRQATRNPKTVKKDGTPPILFRKRQLSFLWRPELAMLLKENGLPGYAGKSKAFVCQALLERVPVDVLKHQVCECLIERDYEAALRRIEEYRERKKKSKK